MPWGNATIKQTSVVPTPTDVGSSASGAQAFTSHSSGSAVTDLRSSTTDLSMNTHTAPIVTPSDTASSGQASTANTRTSTASKSAGVVAGAIVGGLLLIGISVYVLLREHRRRRLLPLLSSPTSPPAHSDGVHSAKNALVEATDICELALDNVLSIPNHAYHFPSPAASPPNPFADEQPWHVDEGPTDKEDTGSTIRDGVLSIRDPAGAQVRVSQGLAFAKLALEAEEIARAAQPTSPARRMLAVPARGVPVPLHGGELGVDSEVERLRLELERVRAERDAERARAWELTLASGDVPPAYCVGMDEMSTHEMQRPRKENRL
jgi:hypothetical protein